MNPSSSHSTLRPSADQLLSAAEIQNRIEAGKEALVNFDIRAAFDQLFLPALVDERAKKLLFKLLSKYQRLRILSKEQIQEQQVEAWAEKGYAVAQYMLGRYHQQVKPDKDSIDKAKKWYDKAQKAGIADAYSCEAVMVLDGYFDWVNMDRYNALIRQGVELGSSKDYCGLPVYRKLNASIYGNLGFTADPQSVIDSVKEIIGPDESDDIEVVDPVYYQLLGDACSQLGDKENAVKYYSKAVDMGLVECYSSCILLSTPNESHTHEAWEMWRKMCKDGGDYGDPLCYVLYAYYYETDYDDLPDDEKPQRTAEILKYFGWAQAMGEEFAAYLLGNYYYNGIDGFEKDHDLAWEWLNNAAYWESSSAYAMLAQMIEEDYKPERYDQEWADFFHLQALRRGEKDELAKVVEIYQSGRLTDYAGEIESIYIPRFEKQMAEIPEDDFEDEEDYEEDDYEDDRKLIAIIKTDGTADIIEFDVTYWDELPAFVGANRLDAIRVQPLYDISSKLGYPEHITGWVDNMGLLKNLPMNPVGCRIYPGPIAGDMILTLEDSHYNPMSFTDLDDLKEVVADLGAKLVRIDLDDGPDDDGRFDAWS